MKILHKPHLAEKHVKHSAGFGIAIGTILEAAHLLYPSGLIILGVAGCLAVYEPYIIHTVKGDLGDDN